MQPVTDALATFVAGFVSGQGSFTGASDGTRFTFSIGLAAADRAICVGLQSFFGVGRVVDFPRRKVHFDDESAFTVQALKDLLDVIVPFMDEYLPESYKRQQYLAWRGRLFDYWDRRAKRVRSCVVEGCETVRRPHGLCRHHLYQRYWC